MIPSSGSVTLARDRTPYQHRDLASCFKMQCFICVMYLMIICSAYPPNNRQSTKTHEKRSLFHDVIESLRIRAQLPDDYNPNEENNISQNYESYGFENEPLQLPGDSEFMPRRNDRIEMPTLKYRFPKSFTANDSITEEEFSPKEEIVLYIDSPTDAPIKVTQKPKRPNRPRPQVTKKPNKNNFDNETEDVGPGMDNKPSNMLAGQSQIGNRDTQTVVKPTVIVNFRGTVTHRESEIRLERRSNNETKAEVPQNVFNIKQEVNLERARLNTGSKDLKKEQDKLTQTVKIKGEDKKPKIEEDMVMCETNSWNEKSGRGSKQYNVLQILLNI